MLVTAKSSGITVMRYFVTRYSQHCSLPYLKNTNTSTKGYFKIEV